MNAEATGVQVYHVNIWMHWVGDQTSTCHNGGCKCDRTREFMMHRVNPDRFNRKTLDISRQCWSVIGWTRKTTDMLECWNSNERGSCINHIAITIEFVCSVLDMCSIELQTATIWIRICVDQHCKIYRRPSCDILHANVWIYISTYIKYTNISRCKIWCVVIIEINTYIIMEPCIKS